MVGSKAPKPASKPVSASKSASKSAPKTASKSAPKTASKTAATSSAASAVEKRLDTDGKRRDTNGEWYTEAEFYTFYGGYTEWDAAPTRTAVAEAEAKAKAEAEVEAAKAAAVEAAQRAAEEAAKDADKKAKAKAEAEAKAKAEAEAKAKAEAEAKAKAEEASKKAMDDVFGYIKGRNTRNDTQSYIADGERKADLGKEALLATFKKYIAGECGTQANMFLSQLNLTCDATKDTKLGKEQDSVTYIKFNINILCNDGKLPIDESGLHWTAHVSMLNDDYITAIKGYNPYRLSHITFIHCRPPCTREADKDKSLHVYSNTKLDGNLPQELRGLPDEISRTRLQVFSNLVFFFIKNHQTQVIEANDQNKYNRAKRADIAKRDRSLDVRQQPLRINERLYTRQGAQTARMGGSRRFTFKKLLRKTLYTKKKRKAIKSTQKNKRRK